MTQLILTANGLRGTIPPELGNATELEFVVKQQINWNHFRTIFELGWFSVFGRKQLLERYFAR